MPPRQRAARPTGPTPVQATQHADKRVNLPTADAEVFAGPEVSEVKRLRWQRDPSLDPQLVWRGKDDHADDLVADAPPIYIQEKIDARVLVENLRKTAQEGQEEPEATLFDSFDGLDELDLVDFYRHGANWSNRMVLGDSLQVMASLAEREAMRGTVQMIYLDPPYGIKFGSNWQVSTRKRDVKDGKLEDAAREAEQIKAFRDTWELGIGSYLTYLRDRLVVARDLLTESGSVFVQIGDENVHLVRSLLDEVFGAENFVSQITYKTTSGAGSPSGGTDSIAGVTDYLLWYSRNKESLKYRQIYLPKIVDGAGGGQYVYIEHADGSRERRNKDSPVDAIDRAFCYDQLISQSGVEKTKYPVFIDGKIFTPAKGVWKTSEAGMTSLISANRIAPIGNVLRYVRYLEDFPAFPINNLWDDTVTSGFGDPKTYVVQTNAKIIERCLLMTTDPGDLVLDPTCGSGTTAYVAEQWGRRWITVDTSRVALALARQRLMGAKYPYYLLADSDAGRAKEAALAGRALPPAPTSDDVRQGFVYERVPHVTLKSIANNPDIKEGMSRKAIDEAIARHADVETLYDRPYEDKRTVRVSGPFTVESLSPHRALSFAPATSTDPVETERETISEHAAAVEPAATTFEQTILDNLVRAGVQNGRRAERIEFASLDAHAGSYVQAVGERRISAEDAAGGLPGQVAITVGPQYGTVSQKFIKEAAREAIAMPDVDLLCVLGFAFDPNALGITEDDGITVEAGEDGFAEVAGARSVGRIKVLFVRMNADLLMGEDLKKTGAGNLFTVFGEPDIEVRSAGENRHEVELLGVDVYDPTTGAVRSGGTDKVALWMIDTAYDGESFFVRHCYFTGGNDPLKRLKTALKADIDADAWASLYGTVSRPFDTPPSGKIAVKVINDYGDEVMKVFTIGG